MKRIQKKIKTKLPNWGKELIQWSVVFGLFFFLIIFILPIKISAAPIAGVTDELGQLYEQVQIEIEEQLEYEALMQQQLEAEQAIIEDKFLIKKVVEEIQESNYCNYSEDEFRLMVSIIWAESGNQPLEGQKAVGIVVQNRVESNEWPDTIYDVIYQHGQFQPVRDGQLDKAFRKYDAGEIPESCYIAAEYALQGNKTIDVGWDIINLGDYFFFCRHMENPRLVYVDHQFR